jgi:hypothetical protein
MAFAGLEKDAAGGAKGRDNGIYPFFQARPAEAGLQGMGPVPVRFHIDPAFHAFFRKKKGLKHPEEEAPCLI